MLRDNTPEHPLSSTIDRMRARIAKLESEEEAEDQRRAAMLTKAPAAKEMVELAQREERILAKREAERVQKQAEMTELAERLKRRERELLASRENKSQAYARARQLQEEEREARSFDELVAR